MVQVDMGLFTMPGYCNRNSIVRKIILITKISLL